MNNCQHQTDSPRPPGAVDALPPIDWPDEDGALDAALSTVQQRIDAFVEGLELHLHHLGRQGALLEERSAELQCRHDKLDQLRTELEQTQKRLVEEQERQTAERAALDAERAALGVDRAALEAQADQRPAEDAPPDRGSGQVEQAAPEPADSHETTAGASAEGDTVVSPAESDKAHMLARLGHDAPVEPQPEAQPDDRASAPAKSAQPEPPAPAADIAPPPGAVTQAIIDQQEEPEAQSEAAQGDVSSLDLDPETAHKLRMLRRLNPGKSDVELLAQLQSRQPAEQKQSRAKKSWWKRGK
jgi:hypothetical protein